MPYGRYSRYRRRRYGRRRPYSSRPSYGQYVSKAASTGLGVVKALSMAKAAGAGVSYLMGLVNSEMYKFDFAQTDTPANTGLITHITGMAQGDTDSSRSGNSIYVRGLLLRYTSTINASATNTFVRVMVVRDNQQVGDNVPTVANVLDSLTVISPLNNETVGRFSVIYDKVHTLQVANNTAGYVKQYFKMNSHVRYNGAGASDIQKNGLYVLTLSSEATNTPSVAWQTRLFYRDN